MNLQYCDWKYDYFARIENRNGLAIEAIVLSCYTILKERKYVSVNDTAAVQKIKSYYCTASYLLEGRRRSVELVSSYMIGMFGHSCSCCREGISCSWVDNIERSNVHWNLIDTQDWTPSALVTLPNYEQQMKWLMSPSYTPC